MFKYLYKYLQKSNIPNSKIEEFKIQIRSHPNYPSLLAISDTLTFLNINNAAFHMEFQDIANLPENFIALLKIKEDEEAYPKLIKKNKTSNDFWTFEEKAGNNYRPIDIGFLEKNWSGTVFLIEENDKKNAPTDLSYKFLLAAGALSLLFLLFSKEIDLFVLAFLLVTCAGFYVTWNILKELYTEEQGALKKLCRLNRQTNCSQVLNSKKWKIFEFINFSDLPVFLFSTQFVVLILAILLNQINLFIFIAFSTLVCFGIPVILLSLIYQKYIERKWCTLCLLISSIIGLEMGLLGYWFSDQDWQVDLIKGNTLPFLVSSILVLTSVILGWFWLKQILIERKDIKQKFVKLGKTIKDYRLFKLGLLDSERKMFPTHCLHLGEESAPLKISFVTNPFCSYCKEVLEIIQAGLKVNPNKIKVEIILLGYDEQDRDKTAIFEGLVSCYMKGGGKLFLKAYVDFLNSQNSDSWLSMYGTDNTFKEKSKNLLIEHRLWAVDNKISFTPTLYINNCKFPKAYDYDSFKHFIPSMVEDVYFFEENEKI